MDVTINVTTYTGYTKKIKKGITGSFPFEIH
jgi:hypothetical protein